MIYCEQLLAVAGFEPWNALTNAAFLLAAWLGWRSFARTGSAVPPSARVLVALCGLIGLGSFAWHATGAPWAQWADVVPILGFVLVFLYVALRALLGAPAPLAVAACAALIGAALVAMRLFGPALNGSIAYVPVWLSLLACSVVLHLRGSAAWPRFALATLLFAVSLTFRSIDLAVCAATHSRGTHWLWHLCNALLLYVLMQALALHRARVAPA